MRMLHQIVAIVFIIVTISAMGADPGVKPVDTEFLRGYLAGEYDLIGRKPDGATTYSGCVKLRVEGGDLQATRTMNGKTQKSPVKFDTVAGTDHIPVLRMRFSVDGVEYEGTYLWQSDADNYPRLTGCIYLPNNRTKSPGLEALFPIHR